MHEGRSLLYRREMGFMIFGFGFVVKELRSGFLGIWMGNRINGV
jgi:hypothetical protein